MLLVVATALARRPRAQRREESDKGDSRVVTIAGEGEPNFSGTADGP